MIEAGLLDDRRVELLNGLVLEMAPEGPDHADLSTGVAEFLITRSQGRYQVRDAKPITITETGSEPEPDIALVRRQAYRQGHPTPADVFLIIEFANSSLEKDTDEKRHAYAAAGIADYWVANLRDGVLIVYRDPQGDDYQQEQRLNDGTIAPLAFPDLIIDVRALL
ncbi:Uma2 family endonuclease [Leptolyngbya iicbica LK]|uniref:Uma2 family endonuclease n=3 Tax=Cyanophyceae TaxID=3028117 RepID=A0A4Q7EI11_9CYAN|nr:Uma2 family endonuclease [Leptolyngbya sp. LK]